MGGVDSATTRIGQPEHALLTKSTGGVDVSAARLLSTKIRSWFRVLFESEEAGLLAAAAAASSMKAFRRAGSENLGSNWDQPPHFIEGENMF